MAMITPGLLAEFQARVDRGEHINSTVHEEEQLLHSHRVRAGLLEALEGAYTLALLMPHNLVRVRSQGTFCAMRDAIADATHRTSEEVQTSHEAAAYALSLMLAKKTEPPRGEDRRMKTNNIATGIVGRCVNRETTNEADHFYKCPACGQAVDMRDLGQVFHHEDAGHEPLALDA
jgi:hypothetical protein